MSDRVQAIQGHFEQMYREGFMPWTEHGLEPAIPAFADRLLVEEATRYILDIGCGNGWVSIYFAQRGLKVEGIDSSPTAIAEAQALAHHAGVADRAAFRVGNGLELPYEDGVFTAVFDRGFFHHVPEEHYEQYLQEVGRVLKPRGWLSLHAFSGRNSGRIGHRFERGNVEQIFGNTFEILEDAADPWPTDAPAHLNHYLLRKRA
jgi:cyclopropane fatty-acyl-phospholipid synthase-like methyltransferase